MLYLVEIAHFVLAIFVWLESLETVPLKYKRRLFAAIPTHPLNPASCVTATRPLSDFPLAKIPAMTTPVAAQLLPTKQAYFHRNPDSCLSQGPHLCTEIKI